MSDIPKEIMYHEILPRVPVEGLFRFRSVCKTWRCVIDNPDFSKLHFQRGLGGNWFVQRHGKGGKLFLTDKVFKKVRYVEYFRPSTIKTPLDLEVPHIRPLPVPTCNGLMLLSSPSDYMVWRIWNPFTGESLELGQCDEFQKLDTLDCGIGYDETNDDYKVVRIDGSRTFVYSVNSREWRRIEDFPDRPGGGNGVFAHGSLHWFYRPREPNDGLQFSVAALDLSTERYRRINLPVAIGHLRLDALSGCLFASFSDSRGKFVAWMSKDYGSENMTWVKMISLEDTNIIRAVAYLKNKQRVLLQQYEKDTFLWYDLVKNCSESLLITIDEKADDFKEKYLKDTHRGFFPQVLPASLVRLRRSDGADKGAVPAATLNRRSKRKINVSIARERTCRLPMKLVLGDPEKWPSDWTSTTNSGGESD